MKVVLFGASGTIGKAIVAELGSRHEIVAVGSRSGDVQVDVTDAADRPTLGQADPSDDPRRSLLSAQPHQALCRWPLQEPQAGFDAEETRINQRRLSLVH